MAFRIIWIGLALTCWGARARAQQEEGLVGHWDFDEGPGEVARDVSGNHNHGVVQGPVWVERGTGYALSFDGVDDYVDCGHSPSLDLTSAVSLEAWVQPGSLPPHEPLIVGKFFESYGLTHYKDGQSWFYISGGGTM